MLLLVRSGDGDGGKRRGREGYTYRNSTRKRRVTQVNYLLDLCDFAMLLLIIFLY